MDPQATWKLMIDAFIEHDWLGMQEAAEALMNWMSRSGCPPETVPGRHMGSLWNQQIATATCSFASDLAKRVLADPNGIPTGVPFSLSCCECDYSSPDSFSEAISEGWTGIEFTPEGLAENFLGLCPEHSD